MIPTDVLVVLCGGWIDEQRNIADRDLAEAAAVIKVDVDDDRWPGPVGWLGCGQAHDRSHARESRTWQAGAMRGLVQRVARAEVRSRPTSDGPWSVGGSIGAGLCVFVGVTHDDTMAHADKLAAKIWGLRILDDAAGVMNRSL